MAYPGVVDDLRTCAALGVPSRVPVFALGEEFDVEMCGADYREYIHSPRMMIDCQVQAVERFDYDWILLHPDDYIELEPLGIETIVRERMPPAAVSNPPASRETLQALELPDPHRDGRMPAHLEALAGIKDAFGDELCVAGRVAAPFSTVALLYGIREGLILVLDDPELFHDTADLCAELMIMWGRAQLDAGADAIWLGDCVAASGFISPQQYADFALDPARRVSDALREHGGIVIYHAGEVSLPHLQLQAPQFEIINLGEGCHMAQMKAALGDTVCLSGNADPIALMNCESLAEVEAETRRIVEAGKPGGGYVFNTGEGIPRQVRLAVVETMIQTAKRCGSY
ncbi:MAG: uroporphyrinogen decarboxylase family protein [Armatimonadota bacterium]|nr:uroporphyrinogen decarboxylase family protein [Armatimonadota bacterium]